jgi:hypothetical protein
MKYNTTHSMSRELQKKNCKFVWKELDKLDPPLPKYVAPREVTYTMDDVRESMVKRFIRGLWGDMRCIERLRMIAYRYV